MKDFETEAETRARNAAIDAAKAARLLEKMAACEHEWHYFSEFELTGIYCPRCCTLLDASLGDPWRASRP